MSDNHERDVIPASVVDEAWIEYLYPRTATGRWAEPTEGFRRAVAVFERWASAVLLQEPQPAGQDLRERAAEAAMEAWRRNATMCEHSQIAPVGDVVDAVLAVCSGSLAKTTAVLTEVAAVLAPHRDGDRSLVDTAKKLAARPAVDDETVGSPGWIAAMQAVADLADQCGERAEAHGAHLMAVAFNQMFNSATCGVSDPARAAREAFSWQWDGTVDPNQVVPDGDTVERVARALWHRDAQRAFGTDEGPRRWENVGSIAEQYRDAARAAVRAMSGEGQ